MGWSPPTKVTVILALLCLIGGLFIFIEFFFSVFGGILPPLALGPFTSDQTWGIIGMALVFFAWFLMYLGVQITGM